MTTATKTNRKQGTDLTPSDILTASREDQVRREQEAALYRDIVHKADSGDLSDDERQAAEIVAVRNGWNFKNDVKALRELERVRDQFGDDIPATVSRLWDQLTEQATAIRTLKAETDARLRGMEVARQAMESRHKLAVRDKYLPDQIRKQHSHLFGG
jgi:hypothetical protein